MSEHDCMAISPHGLGVTVCAVPRGPVIRLNWILPRSLWRRISRHRTFLCAHGPLFVPDLWEAVVQRDLSTHPVREFLAPEQVVSDTRLYWSGGMPRDFVGVAGDFMGNLFGFHRTAMNGIRPADLPVSLFDHDYARLDPVASSFDDWLKWFIEHVGAVGARE